MDSSAAGTPLQVHVQLRPEDFEQALGECNRLPSRRRAQPSGIWLVIWAGVGVLIGVLAMEARWWDPYLSIRPPNYMIINLVVPAVVFILLTTTSITRALLWGAALLALAAVPIGRGGWAAYADQDWFGTLLPHALWLLVALGLLAFAFNFIRRSRRSAWEAQPQLLMPKTYQIGPEGVVVTEPDQFRRYQWNAFRRFTDAPDILMLWHSDVAFEIIPKRCFASPEQLQATAQWFRSHISDAQPVQGAFEVVPVAQQGPPPEA
jgi:hypothetical protein